MSVDVAAIRAALVEAQPGPWGFYEFRLGINMADAELIVLLRNNAEALLNELEQERAKNIHWQEVAFAAARDAFAHERRGAVNALRGLDHPLASERADEIEKGADL